MGSRGRGAAGRRRPRPTSGDLAAVVWPGRCNGEEAGNHVQGERQMATQAWQADPTCSELSFKLRHLVLSEIVGRVRTWRATLKLDFERPELCSVEAVMDARTLDTQDPERDEHVRSAE